MKRSELTAHNLYDHCWRGVPGAFRDLHGLANPYGSWVWVAVGMGVGWKFPTCHKPLPTGQVAWVDIGFFFMYSILFPWSLQCLHSTPCPLLPSTTTAKSLLPANSLLPAHAAYACSGPSLTFSLPPKFLWVHQQMSSRIAQVGVTHQTSWTSGCLCLSSEFIILTMTSMPFSTLPLWMTIPYHLLVAAANPDIVSCIAQVGTTHQTSWTSGRLCLSSGSLIATSNTDLRWVSVSHVSLYTYRQSTLMGCGPILWSMDKPDPKIPNSLSATVCNMPTHLGAQWYAAMFGLYHSLWVPQASNPCHCFLPSHIQLVACWVQLFCYVT